MNGKGASALGSGETAYAKLTGGGIAVAESSGGNYVFKGYFSKETPMIDHGSDQYKQALREYNVRAQVRADGKVTVQSGGLYTRKQTFKSKEAFIADAEKRIDSRMGTYQRMLADSRRGHIPQIQAEIFKSYARNSTAADALGKMRKEMESDIRSAAVGIEAGEDMKRRLRASFGRL